MTPLLNAEQQSFDLVERIGCDSNSKLSITDGIKDVVNLISEIVKNPLAVYYVLRLEAERENKLPLDSYERMDQKIQKSASKNYFV